MFNAPVEITAGHHYVVSYYTSSTYIENAQQFATQGSYDPPLRVPVHAGIINTFTTGTDLFYDTFEPLAWSSGTTVRTDSNYGVDVLFAPTAYDRRSLWQHSPIPGSASHFDPTAPIEVGTMFRTDTSGYLTGVRFYKGADNDGLHIAHVFMRAGACTSGSPSLPWSLVAGSTVTFSNEPSCGWAAAEFSSAIAISKDNCYVVSYTTSSQHYAYDAGYFLARGTIRSPLRVGVPPGAPTLSPQVRNLGGVYTYNPSTTPTWSTSGDGNYWVDPVFVSRRR
jgi:hypothetical protein